ncbi:DUF6125 family protein [Chloroflexota bacterium]
MKELIRMIQSELEDYSGDFMPDFSHELLTRETLAGLMRLYGRFRTVLDGSWYLVVKEVAGDETAFLCDRKVWERAINYMIKQITDSMNIKRDGVTSLMKYFQIMDGSITMKAELTSGNLGKLTIIHCPTLESLETEGEGRESNICRVLEADLFRRSAALFDPRIKVRPVVLPPRKSTGDIPCQWEFALEGENTIGISDIGDGKRVLDGKTAGMEDYSGPLIPGIRLEDFSKDALCRILMAYSRLMHRVDGVWYLTIKETMDNQTALACDKKVWSRLARYEVKLISDYFNFRDPTISSVLKFFQTHFLYMTMKHEVELQGPGQGLITTSHCPSLAALEAEGEGREAEICHQMCTMNYQVFADCFNPAIRSVPIIVPPRKGADGISCQWEYRLEC